MRDASRTSANAYETAALTRTEGSFFRGRWTLGNSAVSDIYGSFAPATDKELLILPEGERTKETFSLLTNTELIMSRDGFRSDLVTWNQRSYKVVGKGNWSGHGFYSYLIQAAEPSESTLAFLQINGIYNAGIIMIIDFENLARGSDVPTRASIGSQQGFNWVAISILTKGAPSGIDADNTVVIALKNRAGETILTKTYTAVDQPPTNDMASLGTPAILTSDPDDIVTAEVTQNGTANMPAFSIIFER